MQKEQEWSQNGPPLETSPSSGSWSTIVATTQQQLQQMKEDAEGEKDNFRVQINTQRSTLDKADLSSLRSQRTKAQNQLAAAENGLLRMARWQYFFTNPQALDEVKDQQSIVAQAQEQVTARKRAGTLSPSLEQELEGEQRRLIELESNLPAELLGKPSHITPFTKNLAPTQIASQASEKLLQIAEALSPEDAQPETPQPAESETDLQPLSVDHSPTMPKMSQIVEGNFGSAAQVDLLSRPSSQAQQEYLRTLAIQSGQLVAFANKSPEQAQETSFQEVFLTHYIFSLIAAEALTSSPDPSLKTQVVNLIAQLEQSNIIDQEDLPQAADRFYQQVISKAQKGEQEQKQAQLQLLKTALEPKKEKALEQKKTRIGRHLKEKPPSSLSDKDLLWLESQGVQFPNHPDIRDRLEILHQN